MVVDSKKLYARLLGYVAPYRLAFAVSILAMAIGGAAEASFAWFLKNMLEELFVDKTGHGPIWAALGIVLIFFISGLSHFAAGYGMQWVGNKVILDFRNQMFQRLIRLPQAGTRKSAEREHRRGEVIGRPVVVHPPAMLLFENLGRS